MWGPAEAAGPPTRAPRWQPTIPLLESRNLESPCLLHLLQLVVWFFFFVFFWWIRPIGGSPVAPPTLPGVSLSVPKPDGMFNPISGSCCCCLPIIIVIIWIIIVKTSSVAGKRKHFSPPADSQFARHIGGGPSLSRPSRTGSEWISDRGLDCQILVTKFARFHPLVVDFTLNFFLNSELTDRNSTRCPDWSDVLLLPYFSNFFPSWPRSSSLPPPRDELFLCNSEPYFIGCLYCFFVFFWFFYLIVIEVSFLDSRPIPPPGPFTQKKKRKNMTKKKQGKNLQSSLPKTKVKGPLTMFTWKASGWQFRLRFSHPTTSLFIPLLPSILELPIWPIREKKESFLHGFHIKIQCFAHFFTILLYFYIKYFLIFWRYMNIYV